MTRDGEHPAASPRPAACSSWTRWGAGRPRSTASPSPGPRWNTSPGNAARARRCLPPTTTSFPSSKGSWRAWSIIASPRESSGEDVIFLRKIVPGGADRSYGVAVAKLAGTAQGRSSPARKADHGPPGSQRRSARFHRQDHPRRRQGHAAAAWHRRHRADPALSRRSPNWTW